MNMRERDPESVRVYLSNSHPCPYLPQETASSLIIDPELDIDSHRLTQLTLNGFRRSGDVVYRPHCAGCQACVSVRIPVRAFQPSRAQRRTWNNNRDLKVSTEIPEFREQHFDLYLRYQQARHPDSDMCDANPEKYREFLVAHSRNTVFFEFTSNGRVVGVAVSDELVDGLSAVYVFFDPDLHKRSLGTYAILWQIHHARQRGLPWLYLGYWIQDCPKMSYKTAFKPIQGFVDGCWKPITAADHVANKPRPGFTNVNG